ncbi:WD domain-containing protein [Apiospora phragmitis]|uniref:WD domain-containing protein n=1 Tax=Apiospora phragmitis TaxID=2905665 RepID=A0ABR1WSR4_9PEZI
MSSRSHPSVPRHPQKSIASSAKSSQRTGKAVAEPRDFTSPTPLMKYFEPCAATAGMLLYGQGNSVVVAHHDSLTIERRFSRHSAEVQLLAVDTQSDIGAGRLVVSYDTDMTAIVWDLMTGDEVARFASYENLTCAAWMRNGNVAFGNTQGNIILFEPTTSEHISARTIDQISVTALAPAADCRTFAIGYQNGSLLIATLQPRFTILHNLSTNRAPSPIVNLAWHASSSRQKSDMLAVQTNDGDLRVWSVAKSYSSDDPAKVVRILKRTENYQNAPNWMGWSKNGRIIQFSESETLSWDVRTKHVTYDSIPTLEHVRGLAVYGPGATLFTLGANNTVQQFDLNTPSQMVANVQHPANLLPPSPPVSIEEQSEHGVVIIATDSDSMSAPESMSIPINSEVSESDDDHLSPLARIARGADVAPEIVEQERYMSATPRGRHPPSVLSRGMTENTYISAGSSLRSSAQPPPFGDKDAYSISSISSASMTSSSRASRHRPSRLRNEVPRSPDDAKVHDLFKFTRSRLHDIPYKRAPLVDQSRLTNDDLRRQMLSIIFGWNREIQDLVRDELSRHPQGSPSRILLSKWLGDIDADVMTASSENMTSSDWMLLALSGIGGQASQHKLGRAYVQRLLESGDVHAAATIMIGMGDHNDAIEIYVSHKRYMEALILLCLYFPSVWERQSQIIKKWGEFAVLHGQQQLAIRCFACTGQESSEPWASPSAAQVTFQSLNQSIPEVLSPPLSPPGINRGPQRSIAKTSALKLITSFGDQSAKSKFFAAGDGGQTPIAAGVTPIAESAISPAGYDPATAFIKPSQRSAFNTPSSARVTTPGGFGRQRLPSIGEVRGAEIPTPVVMEEETGSRHRRAHHSRKSSSDEQQYAADDEGCPFATEGPPPPSPSPQSFAALMTQGRTSRNGARDRVPDGIDLKLQSIDAAMSDVTSPEQSVASSTRFHWPTRRRGPGSIASSVTSQSSAGRSHHRAHPPVARGLNDHISSIDAAQRPSRRHRSRGSSRHRNEDHRARSRESSRSRKESTRDASSERGRGAARTYTPKPAKRSPTSPIPMSPEDLINLSTPRNGEDSVVAMHLDNGEPSTVRKSSQIRRTSPRSQRISSRTSSRDTRRRSPERRPLALEIRGRSNDRDDGSMMRSPSSPLPMSAGGHFFGSDDEKDYQAAVDQQENFRNRHNRSRGMKEPNSPAVSRGARDRSESRKRRVKTPLELEAMENPAPLSSQVYKEPARAGAMKLILTERQAKKEAAARELEERRRSLALRPMAPAIPHPDELSPIVSRPPTAFELSNSNSTPPPQDVPQRSATADFTRSSQMRSGKRPFIGLPATPKAMRLQFESDSKGKPNVPPIPSQWTKTSPPSSRQPSPDKPKAESPAKEAKEPSLLTLLPSTVYSPPSRPMIQRCMSAPIDDQQPPSFQSHSRNGSSARKMSIPEASIRGIDEMLGGGGRHSRRASRDDHIPPPPPPPRS